MATNMRLLQIARRSSGQIGMRCPRAWCGIHPSFGLSIWLEPGLSCVTWVHYDASLCRPCLVCSVLHVLHFLRFGPFVL